MKGLEALESIRKKTTKKHKTYTIVSQFDKELEIIEKELKALEIIKEKECLFNGLSGTTQEEFDLLKEVLCDGIS